MNTFDSAGITKKAFTSVRAFFVFSSFKESQTLDIFVCFDSGFRARTGSNDCLAVMGIGTIAGSEDARQS